MNNDLEHRLKSIENRLETLEDNLFDEKQQNGDTCDCIIELEKYSKNFINTLSQIILNELILINVEPRPIRYSIDKNVIKHSLIPPKRIIESDIRIIEGKISKNLFTKEDMIEFLKLDSISVRLHRIYYFFNAQHKEIILNIDKADKFYKDGQTLYYLSFVC